MRSRILLAVMAIVALAALALGRGPTRQPPAPGSTRPAPAASQPPAPPPAVDPEAIRDLFHPAAAFPRPARRPASAAAPVGQPIPEPPAGPRLVGLVSRGGRLLAALAADGEVVLAGPGETAAGVTVVAVDEEGVRVRRPDGTEDDLVLP